MLFYRLFQFKDDLATHLEMLLLPWQRNLQIYTHHNWTVMFLDSNRPT